MALVARHKPLEGALPHHRCGGNATRDSSFSLSPAHVSDRPLQLGTQRASSLVAFPVISHYSPNTGKSSTPVWLARGDQTLRHALRVGCAFNRLLNGGCSLKAIIWGI